MLIFKLNGCPDKGWTGYSSYTVVTSFIHQDEVKTIIFGDEGYKVITSESFKLVCDGELPYLLSFDTIPEVCVDESISNSILEIDILRHKALLRLSSKCSDKVRTDIISICIERLENLVDPNTPTNYKIKWDKIKQDYDLIRF